MNLSSMYPFYSELVDHLYHRPVVISILIPLSMVKRKKKQKSREQQTMEGKKDVIPYTSETAHESEDESTVVDLAAADDPNRYINPTSPIRGPIHEEIQTPAAERENAMKFLDDAGSLSVAPSSLDGSLERAASAVATTQINVGRTHQPAVGGRRATELRTHAAILRAKLKVFTIKVVDLIDSREALHPIVVRDYNLLRRELCEEHRTSAVNEYFQPRSLLWWMRFLKFVLRVFDKTGSVFDDHLMKSPSRAGSAGSPGARKSLAAVVDKRLIRSMVHRKLEHHRWMYQSVAGPDAAAAGPNRAANAIPAGRDNATQEVRAAAESDTEVSIAESTNMEAAADAAPKVNAEASDCAENEIEDNVVPDQTASDQSYVATSDSATSVEGLPHERKVRKKKRKKSSSHKTNIQTVSQRPPRAAAEKLAATQMAIKMRPLPESYSPPLSSPIGSRPGSREAYPTIKYAQNHPSSAAHRLDVMRSTSGSNAPSRAASRANSRPVSRHGSVGVKDTADGIDVVALSTAVQEASAQRERASEQPPAGAGGDASDAADAGASGASADEMKAHSHSDKSNTRKKKQKRRSKQSATAAVLMQSDAVSLSGESLDFSQDSGGEVAVPKRRSQQHKRSAASAPSSLTAKGRKGVKMKYGTKGTLHAVPLEDIRTALAPVRVDRPKEQLEIIDQHHSPWEERYTYVAARSPRPSDSKSADGADKHSATPTKEAAVSKEAAATDSAAEDSHDETINLVTAALEAVAVSGGVSSDGEDKGRSSAESKRRRQQKFEREIKKYASGGSQQRVANIISWARTAVGGDEKFRTRKLNKTEVKLISR